LLTEGRKETETLCHSFPYCRYSIPHSVSSKDGAASFYSEEDKKCPKGIRSNYRDWPAQPDKLERYTT